MDNERINLPVMQSYVLLHVFEEVFVEAHEFEFKYVPLDQIFNFLINGNEDDIFERIYESCKEDVQSYLNAIEMVEWIDILIEEAERLEYFEICHNSNILRKQLKSIINATEEFYSRNISDLSECDN